jgi:hypothetical protein
MLFILTGHVGSAIVSYTNILYTPFQAYQSMVYLEWFELYSTVCQCSGHGRDKREASAHTTVPWPVADSLAQTAKETSVQTSTWPGI